MHGGTGERDSRRLKSGITVTGGSLSYLAIRSTPPLVADWSHYALGLRLLIAAARVA